MILFSFNEPSPSVVGTCPVFVTQEMNVNFCSGVRQCYYCLILCVLRVYYGLWPCPNIILNQYFLNGSASK